MRGVISNNEMKGGARKLDEDKYIRRNQVQLQGLILKQK